MFIVWLFMKLIKKTRLFPPSCRMLSFPNCDQIWPTLFLRNRKSPTKTMARRTPLKTSRKIRSPSFVEHSITLKTSRHIQVTEYSINYCFATEKNIFYRNLSQVFPNCTSESQSILHFCHFLKNVSSIIQ